MSDNVNAAIVQPMGIDVLGQYQKWQALQQAQNTNALTQQQTVNAQLANQANQLQLSKAQVLAAPFLPAGAPGMQGAPVPSHLPPPAQAAPANALSGVAPSGAAVSAGAGAEPQPAASNLGAAPVTPAAGTPVSAATHSVGMPAPGQILGQTVSPTGAVQTMYGVPLPFGWAQQIAFNPEKAGEILKTGMEERRQRLQELLSQPDFAQGVQQAWQEGWMDTQHATTAMANPQIRSALLAGLVSPDAYFGTLEKYSGQGLRPDPKTGELVVSPVAVAASGAKAEATAAGTSAGELGNARALAADRALGGAAAETVDVPTPLLDVNGQPQLGPDGSVLMTTRKVNKAALAEATGAGAGTGANENGNPRYSLSDLTGTRRLEPVQGTNALNPLLPSGAASSGGPNPLLGPIPSNMLPGGAAAPAGGWGQSPSNVPMSTPPRGSMLPAVVPGPAGGNALAGVPGAAPMAVALPAAPPGGAVVPSSVPGGGLNGTLMPATAAQPRPAAPAAASVPGIDTGMPSLTPQQNAALEVGKSKTIAQNASDITAMQGYREKAVEASASAQTQNAILDQMRNEAAGFDHGSFANVIQGIKKDVGSFAQVFGGAVPDSVASWEDFQKNFGTLARSTAMALSSRVGLGELELVQKYLPSATMSSQGFNRIADQLQGLNDYAQAKATAAANFQGNPAQFESTFQKAVTPGAFIVARMPPADLKTFLDNMNSTAEGRATVAKIRDGIAYAREHGLMQEGAQ